MRYRIVIRTVLGTLSAETDVGLNCDLVRVIEYQDMCSSQGSSHNPAFVLQWNFYSSSNILIYKGNMDLTSANLYHDTYKSYKCDKNC
jgi:hypothetical protein